MHPGICNRNSLLKVLVSGFFCFVKKVISGPPCRKNASSNSTLALCPKRNYFAMNEKEEERREADELTQRYTPGLKQYIIS